MYNNKLAVLILVLLLWRYFLPFFFLKRVSQEMISLTLINSCQYYYSSSTFESDWSFLVFLCYVLITTGTWYTS